VGLVGYLKRKVYEVILGKKECSVGGGEWVILTLTLSFLMGSRW